MEPTAVALVLNLLVANPAGMKLLYQSIRCIEVSWGYSCIKNEMVVCLHRKEQMAADSNTDSIREFKISINAARSDERLHPASSRNQGIPGHTSAMQCFYPIKWNKRAFAITVAFLLWFNQDGVANIRMQM